MHVAVLQISATPLEPGLLSPATLLFNHLIQGIMPIINRLPINIGNDDKHNDVLFSGHTNNDRKYDTTRNYASFSIGSTVVVQEGDGGPWTHGIVIGRGDHNQSNSSYTVRLTKQAT